MKLFRMPTISINLEKVECAVLDDNADLEIYFASADPIRIAAKDAPGFLRSMELARLPYFLFLFFDLFEKFRKRFKDSFRR